MVGVPESCGFGESIAVVVLALRCPRETVAHREPRRIVGRRFDQDCVGVRRIERAQIRVQIARKFGGVAACRNPDALEISGALECPGEHREPFVAFGQLRELGAERVSSQQRCRGARRVVRCQAARYARRRGDSSAGASRPPKKLFATSSTASGLALVLWK